MPTYDYRCEKCGVFQEIQGIKERPLNGCPTCGQSVKRLIGKNVGIVLKGTGFYSTDNKVEKKTSDNTKAS